MKEYINKNNLSVGLIGLLLGALLTYTCSSVYHRYSGRNMMGRGYMGGMMEGERSYKNKGGMHRMADGTMMGNDNGGAKMDMGNMMNSMMLVNMKGKAGTELTKAFLTDMIPHHQGAIDMAKLLIQDKTTSPEIVKFANDIITAQSKEIEMMKSWLNTKYK